MKKIAIFASGRGSNAQSIIDHFEESEMAKVSLVLTNKPGAGVLTIAQNADIPTVVFSREDFYKNDSVLNKLKESNIDWIVLAGFLWLVPAKMITEFPGKIINIHPALLPKYGGKGMYGMHIHKAVVANGEKESGLTIHFVNEKYDEGDIILQEKVGISENETAESLQKKVLRLEHKFYPLVIQDLIRKELQND